MQFPCETLTFLQQQVEAKHLPYSIVKGFEHLNLALYNKQVQNNIISSTNEVLSMSDVNRNSCNRVIKGVFHSSADDQQHALRIKTMSHIFFSEDQITL